MGIFELLLLFLVSTHCAAEDDARIIATVNRVSITAGDVQFAAIQQGVEDEGRAEAEPKLSDRLIDRQLIRSFLASRKIEASDEDLQFQIARAEELITKRGEKPDQLLRKIGYTPERLKRELGLTLAWQKYARQAITSEQFKSYFEKHKAEFDGTQLRASQIFFKLTKPVSDDEKAAKIQRLAEIRRDISAKKLSFADAAKQYSEAPSRDHGGDVGLFGWQGKLPAVVSHAAFDLKTNEMSEPIVSPVGIHLIQVTERHPGDFSLEDVRPVIFDRLSQQLWVDTVEKERKTAKIERNLVP